MSLIRGVSLLLGLILLPGLAGYVLASSPPKDGRWETQCKYIGMSTGQTYCQGVCSPRNNGTDCFARINVGGQDGYAFAAQEPCSCSVWIPAQE